MIITDYYGMEYLGDILAQGEIPPGFTVGEWQDGGAGGPIYAQSMEEIRQFLSGTEFNSGTIERCFTLAELRTGPLDENRR